jgi:large subunit ribosomal protein L22
MEVQAVCRFARMSASKGQQMARLLRGMPVAKALKATEYNPAKAAFLIGKTLKSAIANAEHNSKLAADTLQVKEVVIGEGPRLKRFWPRARGSAAPVMKRLCHVKVVLTDGKDEEVPRGEEGGAV